MPPLPTQSQSYSVAPEPPVIMFLCLLTGEESIILMTKDFDPITEFPIHTSEFGEGLLLLKDVATYSIIIFIIITIIYGTHLFHFKQ